VFIAQLFEIQYCNYDIIAPKMFTIPPPFQPPELDGIRSGHKRYNDPPNIEAGFF
jgi:hypothetical protein